MNLRVIDLERILEAPPDRAYRMWADADTLSQWLSYQVTGSLLPGARSVLVFQDQRIEVDVLLAEPPERFRFRWLHQEDGLATEVDVGITPRGWGSLVRLTDGPYDAGVPQQLEAYVKAVEIWASALAQMRASVDFSVDLRTGR